MLPRYEEPIVDVSIFEVDTITTSGSSSWDDFIVLPDVGMQ